MASTNKESSFSVGFGDDVVIATKSNSTIVPDTVFSCGNNIKSNSNSSGRGLATVVSIDRASDMEI
jgi:hypothetical protein